MIHELEIELPFSLGRGRCFRRMFYFYGKRWIVVSALILIAGIACGVLIDVRCFLLDLIGLFAGVPMLCLFIYYYYGLNRECYLNVFPHTLRITDTGIAVKVFFPAYEDNEEDDGNGEDREDDYDGEKKCDQEEEDTGVDDSPEDVGLRPEKYGEIREFEYPFSALSNVYVGNKEVFFLIHRPAKGFLWIPESAFGETAGFRIFVEELMRRVGCSGCRG